MTFESNFLFPPKVQAANVRIFLSLKGSFQLIASENQAIVTAYCSRAGEWTPGIGLTMTTRRSGLLHHGSARPAFESLNEKCYSRAHQFTLPLSHLMQGERNKVKPMKRQRTKVIGVKPNVPG